MDRYVYKNFREPFQFVEAKEFEDHKQAMDYGVQLSHEVGHSLVVKREGGPSTEHFFFVLPPNKSRNYRSFMRFR